MSEFDIKNRLASFYLQYVNDFLTIARFSEYHEITENNAELLLKLGKSFHEERLDNLSVYKK
jgi:hypothetical protein